MANIIEAKFNDTPYIWNPLDPNNWQGGVVPGKNDVARFKRRGTVYSTYEDDDFMAFNNMNTANLANSRIITPHNFRHGKFTASLFADIGSQLTGIHNQRTGSQLGTAGGGYGGDLNDPTNGRYYGLGLQNTSVTYNSTLGRSGSYNKTTETYWKYRYSSFFQSSNNNYLSNRYFLFARQYRVWYDNRSNTSLTIDGVTVAEPNGTVGDPYYSASRPFGMTKEDYLAANPGSYPMVDRMVDLFTGSALHVSNGGKYEIIGPHQARYDNAGYQNNYYLNRIAAFTIFTTTGSEYRNSGASSGPSFGSTSYTGQNLYPYDRAGGLRAMHAFGMQGITGFSGSASSLRDVINQQNFIYKPESTASIKYGLSDTNNADGNYNQVFISGSGHLYINNNYANYSGMGPGNSGWIKFKFEDIIYTSEFKNVEIDTSYGGWKTGSVENPMFPTITGQLDNAGFLSYGRRFYTDNLLQRWELTGSQAWEVGRIEMGYATHFHVKDDSHIKLYDLEDSTYYPSIDFSDYGISSTLLITDQAQVELTSSRSSHIPWATYGWESGIYQRRTQCSIIISGSANYTSSIVTEPASTSDASIKIANATASFGIGDYITIQSTGSIRIDSRNKASAIAENIISATDKSTWVSSSFDTGSIINSALSYSYGYYQTNPTVGGYNTSNYQYWPVQEEFTHTTETDELVQVMTMSGDYITVGKMYGKEGEIQSDMGLFTQDQFTETFGESSDTIYEGQKRVVLVDSSHKNFKTGETLVISGSAYKILHATTYLSQSHFYEFTSSNQPALSDVFDLNTTSYSGSSIWPTGTDATYGGINSPTVYFKEQYMKDRLLITGSYRGSNFWTDFPTSNAYYYPYTSNRTLGGKSGSNANPATGEIHRGLQLDLTQCYTWMNSYAPWTNQVSYKYRYNAINGGSGWWGKYQLKDTSNFDEGEIIVSGSILRAGLFDYTSSIGISHHNNFGITLGETPYTGKKAGSYYTYNGGEADSTMYPDPNAPHFRIAGDNGGVIMRGHGGNRYGVGMMFAPTISGSQVYTVYDNPGTPYRRPARRFWPGFETDPEYINSGVDVMPGMNNYTASWTNMTQSLIDEYNNGGPVGGSYHFKLAIQDGQGDYYLGTGNNEVHVDRFNIDGWRGRISLLLAYYASIYSVNIKQRWQQLILDTNDSVSYRDRIKEGGLLYNHYAGKESKFIATEVVDAKGMKNILLEYERTKGNTDILPHMEAVCSSGTTAGADTGAENSNAWEFVTDRYRSYEVLGPKLSGVNSYWSYGQSNANYYIIIDLGTDVTFDTVGVIHTKDSHQRETDCQNKMNDVQFEVCSNIGLATPNWQVVREEYDDTRQSGEQGDIRFYTFPSGSVSARYIKWKNRGGTNSTNYRYFTHFGVYNFSGSCAESNTLDPNAVAGGFAHSIYGSPTSSMCQVELANTKNFSVGDHIYFWSKQMYSPGRMFSPSYSITTTGYKDVAGLSGYYDKTTPPEGVLGGFRAIHKIEAINGNIVTLDKPVTHTHIDAGTMAYKFNRGKVNLIGDRATPFLIARYTSANKLLINNATFLNGSPYNYNGTQNLPSSNDIMEDVGMILHQENYGLNGRPGFYRNINASHIYFDSTPVGDRNAPYQLKMFNVMGHYGKQTFAQIHPKNNDIVANFNVNLGKGYQGFRVYQTSTYGNLFYSGNVYITNNFMTGDYRADPRMTGGVTVDRGEENSADLSTTLHINGNVSPLGYSYDYQNSTTEFYNVSPFADRGAVKRATNSISRNLWYMPSHINPRFRAAMGYDNTFTGVGTANVSSYYSFGRSPFLIQPHQVKRFGERPYIMLGEVNYMISIVKSRTFASDKLYELYTMGNSYGSPKSTSNTSLCPIICKFRVLEDDVETRFDIDFLYKMTLFKIYGGTLYQGTMVNKDISTPGDGNPQIILQNDKTKEVLYTSFLASSQLTDVSSSQIHTLPKGFYSIYIYVKNGYYRPGGSVSMSFKKLDLKIATPDISKIHIMYNNWDLLKLFDNQDHYENQNNGHFTESSGRNRVLRQTTDLTKKLKFNKLKL
jgi:hypothetical protein